MKLSTFSSRGFDILYAPRDEIERVRESLIDLPSKSLITAHALRINALAMIKNAGSGHPGTSLSVADLITSIGECLEQRGLSINTKDGGAYLFSSKGHDAPFFYAWNVWRGVLPESSLWNLRRLGGLPGHPDRKTPGMVVNTGSLGMGISKAKGLIFARRLKSQDDPYVVVVLGDGELQEGQVWESLPGASRDRMSKLIAVVDANGLQSDSAVGETLPLGDVKSRVEGCGWRYWKVNGHDHAALLHLFDELLGTSGPHFVEATTMKGAGVSMMTTNSEAARFYAFHSGALSDNQHIEAVEELRLRSEFALSALERSPLPIFSVIDQSEPKISLDNLVTCWSYALRTLAKMPEVVVFDADLRLDTGTFRFAEEFPTRYVQSGIAEQDMISMAGSVAIGGGRPVVHSFASFLIRGTEQIFNNATELTDVLYVGALAGVLPGGPGHSHQAVSDVGVMLSIPGMNVYEPSCPSEVAAFVQVFPELRGPSYLRLASWSILPPSEFLPEVGEATLRYKGGRNVILCSSPATASLAVEVASSASHGSGNEWSVMTYPWVSWAIGPETIETLKKADKIILLENNLPCRGLSGRLEEAGFRNVRRLGPTGIPPCGSAVEVLGEVGLSAGAIYEAMMGMHD